MRHWHQKPHLTLWLSIPLILIIGLMAGDTLLDINIHDTYIVIHPVHFGILTALACALLGLGYWLAYRFGGRLIPWMNAAHLLLTLGGLLVILILDQLFEDPLTDYLYNHRLYMGMVLAFGAVLAGQAFYFINVIGSFFRKGRWQGGKTR